MILHNLTMVETKNADSMREENRPQLCVRMNRPQQWRNGGEWSRGEGGKSGENARSPLCPSDVKRKNPLVEWARGQGLTVLPQPPLLSNNYLNYSTKH